MYIVDTFIAYRIDNNLHRYLCVCVCVSMCFPWEMCLSQCAFHYLLVFLRPPPSRRSVFRPAEIVADHLVEALIVLGKVAAQSRHHHRIDVRVFAALGLAQAFVRGVGAQTVEALCLIEVEVVPTDAMLQACRSGAIGCGSKTKVSK